LFNLTQCCNPRSKQLNLQKESKKKTMLIEILTCM
jgi:hypothetical protein